MADSVARSILVKKLRWKELEAAGCAASKIREQRAMNGCLPGLSSLLQVRRSRIPAQMTVLPTSKMGLQYPLL